MCDGHSHSHESAAGGADLSAVLDDGAWNYFDAKIDADPTSDFDRSGKWFGSLAIVSHGSKVSPGPSAGDSLDLVGDCSVEHRRERPADTPPVVDLSEPEGLPPVEPRRIEVLVSDRVPPVVDELEMSLSSWVQSMQGMHSGPEIHPEAAEIGAEVARRRISGIKLSSLGEPRAKDGLERPRLDRRGDHVCGLGMQVTTEPLELRRKHHEVRLVDLLRRIPTPAREATDRSVRSSYLVELLCSRPGPVL
jgi:hypothetical protein